MTDTSTRSLLQRHRRGDREAAERILQRLLPSLFRFARGRLPNWARQDMETSDLVQEAISRLYPKLKTIEISESGDLAAYLRTSIHNQVRDQIRRARVRGARAPVDEHELRLQSEEPTPAEYAEIREDYARYIRALARLREKEREVILLRAQLGASYQEIAERLDFKTADAARMAYTRAVARLETLLSGGE